VSLLVADSGLRFLDQIQWDPCTDRSCQVACLRGLMLVGMVVSSGRLQCW
jgi:hypothetical protein